MLNNDYYAYTIWKTQEAEIERKNKLERMLGTSEERQAQRPVSGKTGIQQFLSLLIRKLS